MMNSKKTYASNNSSKSFMHFVISFFVASFKKTVVIFSSVSQYSRLRICTKYKPFKTGNEISFARFFYFLKFFKNAL